MALKQSLVPSLPPALRLLFDYLLRRDMGPPGDHPSPAPIEQSAVGALTLDRLAWGYVSGTDLDRREPDGFVVWWQAGRTADPQDGGVHVSASSRAFSMAWPAGSTRSYAVSSYRLTYQGEELGPKQQHPSWLGAAS